MSAPHLAAVTVRDVKLRDNRWDERRCPADVRVEGTSAVVPTSEMATSAHAVPKVLTSGATSFGFRATPPVSALSPLAGLRLSCRGGKARGRQLLTTGGTAASVTLGGASYLSVEFCERVTLFLRVGHQGISAEDDVLGDSHL